MVVAIVAVIVGSASVVVAQPAAAAVDLSHWDPGDIISDQAFFDWTSMTEAEIQAFLVAQGAKCKQTPGGPACLKDFVMDTTSRPADNLCSSYVGAAREPASRVIAKVAEACKISPRVLLVIMQKEQGLVTSQAPTARMYEAALGLRCPDNQPCDPAYAGFQNQVFGAARRFNEYAANPTAFRFRPGMTTQIAYHPNAACGTTTVTIRNQATANLLNYTPYVPNAASLAAVTGQGDTCSSYGNRNFYVRFTDWFGTTRGNVGAQILPGWRLHQGRLGDPTGPMACGLTAGGCYQPFVGGHVHWSAATGAQPTWGGIGTRWQGLGSENSPLGYPVAAEVSGLVRGGAMQDFQRGQIHWTPATGAQPTWGGIGTRWRAMGAQNGLLGYPLAAEVTGLVRGGARQDFEGGQVLWSLGNGAWPVRAGIATQWRALGAQDGLLGYPRSEEITGLVRGGAQQDFEGGQMFWSRGNGAYSVRGGIGTQWRSLGGPESPLGYPVSEEITGLVRGGARQDFEGGQVFWVRGNGAFSVRAGIATRWRALSAQDGFLGYPRSEEITGLVRGGARQDFEGGQVFWVRGIGAWSVHGGIGMAWTQGGAEKGRLGYPRSDEIRQGTDIYQLFEGGRITFDSRTGATTITYSG